jgi:hypothetical protein
MIWGAVHAGGSGVDDSGDSVFDEVDVEVDEEAEAFVGDDLISQN